jgi:hypothetical protein
MSITTAIRRAIHGVGGVHVEMARGKMRKTGNVREPLLTRHGGRSCARPVGHVRAVL